MAGLAVAIARDQFSRRQDYLAIHPPSTVKIEPVT